VKQSLAFHVERTATVDRIIFDDACKGIDFPRSRFGSDDVSMAQEDDGTFRTVPFETRDDICATGFIFEYIVLDSVLIEDLLEKPRRLDLIAGWVRSIDAQVLLHQINRHVLILRPVDITAVLRVNGNLKDKKRCY
jgi:hypothetical protein